MSTDTSDSDDGEELQSRVETWIAKQMPIIEMHGGTSAVRKAEPGGETIIELGGGCRGCEVSEITTGNIEAELLQWPEIEEVTVRAPESGESFGVDQPESVMGIDRSEGGRG
jgi:Fe/S biogenesis protein NfuA